MGLPLHQGSPRVTKHHQGAKVRILRRTFPEWSWISLNDFSRDKRCSLICKTPSETPVRQEPSQSQAYNFPDATFIHLNMQVSYRFTPSMLETPVLQGSDGLTVAPAWPCCCVNELQLQALTSVNRIPLMCIWYHQVSSGIWSLNLTPNSQLARLQLPRPISQSLFFPPALCRCQKLSPGGIHAMESMVRPLHVWRAVPTLHHGWSMAASWQLSYALALASGWASPGFHSNAVWINLLLGKIIDLGRWGTTTKS